MHPTQPSSSNLVSILTHPHRKDAQLTHSQTHTIEFNTCLNTKVSPQVNTGCSATQNNFHSRKGKQVVGSSFASLSSSVLIPTCSTLNDARPSSSSWETTHGHNPLQEFIPTISSQTSLSSIEYPEKYEGVDEFDDIAIHSDYIPIDFVASNDERILDPEFFEVQLAEQEEAADTMQHSAA
ncbi:hypothetical protein PIB30_055041 [Stylosanthes scabra]|uniref:Uncharacterized protein n=1 Tax=Stylosanthes scabra TaxID=79078 RepID=A0ABU6UJT8_9FABA|nr:hypothetical protein [Stylosanthes scabra]